MSILGQAMLDFMASNQYVMHAHLLLATIGASSALFDMLGRLHKRKQGGI